jgi:hypothetical protein
MPLKRLLVVLVIVFAVAGVLGLVLLGPAHGSSRPGSVRVPPRSAASKPAKSSPPTPCDPAMCLMLELADTSTTTAERRQILKELKARNITCDHTGPTDVDCYRENNSGGDGWDLSTWKTASKS